MNPTHVIKKSTFILLAVLAVVLTGPSISQAVAPPNLQGKIDSVDKGVITGRAFDTAAPYSQVDLLVSIDSVLIKEMKTNLVEHRFSVDVPEDFYNGQPHTVSIEAVDSKGNSLILKGSELSFTYSKPRGLIRDDIKDGQVYGWAVNSYKPNNPVRIEIYIDQAGVKEFAGHTPANIPREEWLKDGWLQKLRDLLDDQSVNVNHGYGFTIPTKYFDGKIHTVWAYGVSASGRKWELNGSGNVFINLKLTAPVLELSDIANGTVKLKWNDVLGAESYNVYRSRKSDGAYGKINENPYKKTEYVDTGLENGTTYFYKVEAVHDFFKKGEIRSEKSNSVKAMLLGVPVVTAKAGDKEVFLDWANVPGATSYNVYQDGTSIATGVTQSNYHVTGLTNGTTYRFRVRAVNIVGAGPWSEPAVSKPLPFLPAAPVVTASAGDTIVNLDWANVPEAASYNVYQGDLLLKNIIQSNYKVTDLTNGNLYTFKVSAVNEAGEGPKSTAVTATPKSAVREPDAPTGVSATAGNAQATVSFTAPVSNGGSAITGYTVSTSADNSITASGTASPIVVTGLTNGKAYAFTVTATNAVGTSSSSLPSNSVTPATVPGKPTITGVIAGNAQATVSFTAPASNGGSAITGYTVISSPGGITATGQASPIVVTGLTNGTTYIFVVTASNAVGTASSTASGSVTPATAPDAPTGVSATAGNAQAKVSFTAPVSNGGSAITGYTVTSSPAGITQAGASSPITVTKLMNGTPYTFTVTAMNSVGTGSPSLPSNSVTPATVPGKPTITGVTAGDAQVTVNFTAPTSNGGSAITGYIATSSPDGLTATGNATLTSLTVAGLTNGKTYTFTVKAINAVGTGSSSDASSSVTPNKPINPPGKPVVTASVGTSGTVVLGWAAVDGATSYNVYYQDGTTIATKVTQNNYSVTGLTDGTSYSFQVSALNLGGEGAKSTPVSATPFSIKSLYWDAIKAINNYKNNTDETQNQTLLSIAVPLVSGLLPYNSTFAPPANTMGVYDSALNHLISVFKFKRNNLFTLDGAPVGNNAVLQLDHLFVSVPASNSINEYQKKAIYNDDGSVSKSYGWQTIPINTIQLPLNKGYGSLANFGQSFVVNGNTLAALSSSPNNGNVFVNIFHRELDNNGNLVWNLQTPRVNLNKITGKTTTIDKVVLALSEKALVIGMKDIGKYLIYNYSLIYSSTDQGIGTQQWILPVDYPKDMSNLASVSASGDYVAIGATGTNGGSVSILELGADQTTWSPNKSVTSSQPNFGYAVGISEYHGKPTDTGVDDVILAIGSPQENNGQGAIYSLHKTNAGQWPLQLSTLSLLIHSAPDLKPGQALNANTDIGSSLVLNGNVLLVGDDRFATSAAFRSVARYVFENGQWSWQGAVNTASGDALSLSTDGRGIFMLNTGNGSIQIIDELDNNDITKKDILKVNGLKLQLNGQDFEVHGAKFDAFAAPKDWFKIGGEDPNLSLQHAYEYFAATELKYAQTYGANTIDIQVSQYGLDPINPGIQNQTTCQKGICKRVAYSQYYVNELTDAVHLARSMGFVVLLTIADGEFCGNTINASGLPSEVTRRAAENLATIFKDDNGVMIEIFNEPYGDTAKGWQAYISEVNLIINGIRTNEKANNLLVVEAVHQDFSAYPEGSISDSNIIFGVHPYYSFTGVGATSSPSSYTDSNGNRIAFLGWDASFGVFSQTHPVFVSEWNENMTKVAEAPGWCLDPNNDPYIYPAGSSHVDQDRPLNTPLMFFHYLQDHHINGVIGWAFDQPRTIIRNFGEGKPWGLDLSGTCGITPGGIGEWLQDYFKNQLPDVPNN